MARLRGIRYEKLGEYREARDTASDRLIATGHDLGYQIIIMRLNDLASVEFAGPCIHSLWNLIHENLSIDFRRVHRGTAFEQKVSLVRRTFK